ncbi:Tuberoinfundibular peptide of 39 residues [Myotis brandtii]|uniref:Tuberoinfundibular peptide of 39 residues n=1 Tax=Myotis brandtii TaxID=109478 RepID=S7NFF1_MYOBR|nr:Tuberoinfundibular peptide of 39 residues [Myotis brandtii]
METRQVPRSSRARLLLLLLLLVPWGVRTASGVALPPAGVFRYVRRPEFPGGGACGKRTTEKGIRDSERAQRPRKRTETRRRRWLNSYMHKLLVLDAR